MRVSQCGSQRSTDGEGMRGSNGRRTWALDRPTRGRGWGRRRHGGVHCRWRRLTVGRCPAGGSEEAGVICWERRQAAADRRKGTTRAAATPVVTGASTGEAVAAAAGHVGFLSLGEAAAATGHGGFRGGGGRGARAAWWENGSQGTDGEAHGLRGKNENRGGMRERARAPWANLRERRTHAAMDARRTTLIDGRSMKNNFVLFRSRDSGMCFAA
jgi:hypothetical protein